MSRTDRHQADIRREVGGASNVLVRAPTMAVSDGETCRRLLSSADIDGADLLLVSLTQSPDERLAALEPLLADASPANVGVVTAGDPARSAAATSTDAEIDLGAKALSIETVSSPGDLTGLGIRTSSFLSEWEHDGNDVVVCFHSLTTLLQYVDVRQAFRFLHVLTGRFDAVGAFAHYHVDPGAHDEQDVNTLTTVFDAVVEYDEGDWSVKTR